MRPFASGLLLVASIAQAQDAPRDWIDPTTGHRVIRLSGDEGGSSLYFHQNVFTPKGDKFIFNNRDGIVAVEIARFAEGPPKPELIVPGGRHLNTAFRTPDVYHFKLGALFATNVDTKVSREIFKGRANIINADETLAVASGFDAEAPAKVKELGLPMQPTADLSPRGQTGGRLRPGGRSLALAVTNLKTGETKKIHYSTEWINHMQASPTDPNRILFCHEGNWHEVDRVWTIRTDGTGLKLLHTRTMPFEIAGHEFFSHDGKWVWYDLQTPRSKEFWLAGVNVETGERIRYPIERQHWSVHFNISRDGKLFAGDGGGPGSVANLTPLPERKTLDPPGNTQAIFLFTPSPEFELQKLGGETTKVGKLAVEKLVDLSKHNYSLEPNVHITPDNQWVIFRSNMHGRQHVYAVEVRKSS